MTVTCNRSASAVARRLMVPVFDGVGEGFAGGDEHLQRLIGVHPGPGQPTAQCGTGGGEVARLGGKLDLERGGLAVQKKGDVVLIPTAGCEA